MDTKKTKIMYFTELREIVEAANIDDAAEMVAFIDKQIETLEARKEAAAKRAEKKRAESDALTDEILSKIGNELMTVDEIVVALDSEEVTRNKVTARLGKLVKAGTVEKEQVKVGDGKRMAYRLAAADAE